ncbi:hypothetical protein ABU614_05290 [Lysobacter firmicutimachus]|uniref:Uncharacterized protein n=2 Tax=Lysobacter TaxID=68 RepID=A0AAU8MYC1_9GAMM
MTQVLYPMRAADARVRFELTGLGADGRRRRVLDGYRPHYRIRPDYHTSAQHRFLDATEVLTGESAEAEVWLLTPEHYPGTLWVGRRLDISEGARPVGFATVLEVFNPILLGAEAAPERI